MDNREGQVKDLMEKLESKEITAKEVVEALEERELTEKTVFQSGYWGYLIWLVPCFITGFAKATSLSFLSWFANLPSIIFSPIISYIALALFIVSIPLTVSGMYYNVKKGGCETEDHTVILLRSGPYGIVRHPSHVAWSIFFITLPIFLSKYIPFTILSVFGIVGIVIFHYYASIKEEQELDIKKWGDEYKEYMEKVPRWNVLKGLWYLRMRE